jgi:hypothetical protein
MLLKLEDEMAPWGTASRNSVIEDEKLKVGP